MLKIRLQRVGKKHEPVFRVVVCDSKRGPKSNDNVEILGSYDPRDKNETVIDGDRVKHWISNGAQVSDTVTNILINKGIIKGEKVNVLPKKSPVVDEEKLKAEEEAKAAAEAEAKAAEEAPAEEAVEEAKEEAPTEEEPKKEEVVEEVKEEAPAEPEEKKEETEESKEG
jgi:small subunit ribosomal protein S16